MTEAQRKEIEKALIDKGALLPCHRCGKNSFSVFDYYTSMPMLDDFRNVVIGGKSIPSAVIACNHCGNLTIHALGALGMFTSELEHSAPSAPPAPVTAVSGSKK